MLSTARFQQGQRRRRQWEDRTRTCATLFAAICCGVMSAGKSPLGIWESSAGASVSEPSLGGSESDSDCESESESESELESESDESDSESDESATCSWPCRFTVARSSTGANSVEVASSTSAVKLAG